MAGRETSQAGGQEREGISSPVMRGLSQRVKGESRHRKILPVVRDERQRFRHAHRRNDQVGK